MVYLFFFSGSSACSNWYIWSELHWVILRFLPYLLWYVKWVGKSSLYVDCLNWSARSINLCLWLNSFLHARNWTFCPFPAASFYLSSVHAPRSLSPIRDVGSALYSSTPSPSSPLSWRRWRLGTSASPMFIGWRCPTFWDLCQWSQDYGVWTPVHHHINLWCTSLLGQAQFSEISLTKKGQRKKTKNPR